MIPDELIEKIRASEKFNQGFATIEYMAASYLDMGWHTLEDGKERDVRVFEKAEMDEIGLIDEIIPRYRSTYFAHIFSGGTLPGTTATSGRKSSTPTPSRRSSRPACSTRRPPGATADCSARVALAPGWSSTRSSVAGRPRSSHFSSDGV